MSLSGDEFGGAVERHSGWLVPAVVFLVTACLSALVLAYYFARGPSSLGQETASPTDSPVRVSLNIGAVKFRIPANFLPLASARRGGAKQAIELAALLPKMNGYSLGAADDFTATAPNSPVIYVTIKSGPIPLPEQDRLRRIYIPQIEDEYGIEGPFGLRQYAFRADTGYHSQDLFYGQTQVGPEALICDKADAGTPSPNCLRDFALGNGLAVHYRFKRARLSQWEAIDKSVRALVEGFQDKS